MNQKPIPKIGKKGRRNARINRDLKKSAQEQGLPLMCETAYKKFEIKGKLICNGSFGLTWAHSLRRDLWTEPEHETQAALLCIPCHTFAQNLGNEANEQIILAAIARRDNRVEDNYE